MAAAGEDAAGGGGAAGTTLPRIDEEEADIVRNFGDHKLMERVQAALKAQLQAQLARVDDELREQEEAREKARQGREDLGVELYGVQQQLAKLTSDLQGRSASIAALATARGARESELASAQAALAARQAALAEQEASLAAMRGELDGVLDTVRQVERYNADMAAEIALTRRAAAKAEESMGDKEKAKAAQDAYIEQLTAQVRRAADELALLTAQTEAQGAESRRAGETLTEAAAEMEAVRFEKKQLLLQWQASLVALKRRDAALASAGSAIAEAAAAAEGLEAEAGNARRAITAAQAAQARLQEGIDRSEADLRYLEGNTAALQRAAEGLSARREALSGTLEATEEEVRKAAADSARLAKAIAEADRARFLADRARFAEEDAAGSAESERIGQEAAGKALLKEAARLTERARALEASRAEAENGLAAARVDALTIASRVAGLRDRLVAAEGELREREAAAEAAEADLRSQQDTLERKATALDKLNRKWEKLQEAASAGSSEGTGSLAAEAGNLAKQIATTRVESEAAQRRWLADQTALVAATTEAEARAAKLHELGAQSTLLTQKALRLERAVAAEEAEQRRLDGASKAIHDDMARINALIAKNAALSAKLAAATYAAESAFGEELRAAEGEAAAAESRVEALEGEKGRLLGELVEAERQIVLWERKITLEKETQEALDPSEGESEVAGMEREVGRLRLKLEGLKREQAALVAEMERAVAKRDVIAMKHRSARHATMAAAAQTGKGLAAAAGVTKTLLLGGGTSKGRGKASEGDTLTRVGLAHRAAGLRAELATKLAALDEVEGALEEAGREAAAVASNVATRSAAAGDMEATIRDLQARIAGASFQRVVAVERAAAAERMLARFTALEAGRLPPLTGDEVGQVRARLAEAEAARDAAAAVCSRLAELHGDLAEAIARIAELAHVVPALPEG